MRVYILPSSEHNYEQVFTFDGSDYVITLTWNGRTRRWYYRLTDSSGTVLTGDRALVADWPLLADVPSGTLPPGQLWAVSVDGEDPGIFDLSSDFMLVYIPEDEVTS